MLNTKSIVELREHFSNYRHRAIDLLNYLHVELKHFRSDFIDESSSIETIQSRLDTIEFNLHDQNLHFQAMAELIEEMFSLDQSMKSENEEGSSELWLKTKNDFHRLFEQEFVQIQPNLRVRLELSIRTLLTDFDSAHETNRNSSLISIRIDPNILPGIFFTFKELSIENHHWNCSSHSLKFTQNSRSDQYSSSKIH